MVHTTFPAQCAQTETEKRGKAVQVETKTQTDLGTYDATATRPPNSIPTDS